jgi:lauroyl/myristoyl acyltransferase
MSAKRLSYLDSPHAMRSMGIEHTSDPLPRRSEAEFHRCTASLSPVEPSLGGKIVYHLLPSRRRTVIQNIQRAFPELTERKQIIRIAQAFYGHLFRAIFELARGAFMSSEMRSRLVRIEGAESLRAAAAGKGALLLTGHFGNWELAVPIAIGNFPEWQGRVNIIRDFGAGTDALAVQRAGRGGFLVARQIRSRLVGFLSYHAFRRFNRAGMKVISQGGAVRRTLSRLRAQEAVVFVLDHHAGGRNRILVDFMGYPAYTFRSLAVIALASEAPVVPIACYRDTDGTHVVRFDPPLQTIRTGNVTNDIRENTELYNKTLVRLIREHPDQWFWFHERWRYAPGGG